MGNRAVITFSTSKTTGAGVYLHWSGALDHILALCDGAKELGYRDPAADPAYAMARLIGLACFVDGPLSDSGIGVGQLKQLDCNNFDNGVYVIGAGWELIKRWGAGSYPVTREIIGSARRTNHYHATRAHIHLIHGAAAQ